MRYFKQLTLWVTIRSATFDSVIFMVCFIRINTFTRLCSWRFDYEKVIRLEIIMTELREKRLDYVQDIHCLKKDTLPFAHTNALMVLSYVVK